MSVEVIFCESKGKSAKLVVKREAIFSDIKQLLVDDHGFADGEYMFLWNGFKISGESKFDNVVDGAHIVVYVKDVSSTKLKVLPSDYFFKHPAEAAEWVAAFQSSEAVATAMMNYGASANENRNLNSNILVLSGMPLPKKRGNYESEFEAGLEQLSSEQKNGFRMVMDSGNFDRELVLQVFAACNYSPEQTLNILLTL